MGERKHDVVYYDGTCGLCHASVKFILQHDVGGVFHFAPNSGEHGKIALAGLSVIPVADSVIVATSKGRLLYRTDALVYILHELGGVWSILGRVIALLPKLLRDTAYALVAHMRRWFFRAPAGLCPTLPPEVADRFYI